MIDGLDDAKGGLCSPEYNLNGKSSHFLRKIRTKKNKLNTGMRLFRLSILPIDNKLTSVETDGGENERVEDFELRSCHQTQQ